MAKSGNENERGQKLEGMYNTFMGDVSQLFPKTDSNLLLNVMAVSYTHLTLPTILLV